MQIIPERATPELLALQAKLSAQMSYRQVMNMLREFLPVSDKLNHVTVRNRTLRVGARIDQVQPPPTVVPLSAATTEWILAMDGGFVRGRAKTGSRNFEMITGRLAAPKEKPYVFAWVRGEVSSIAERVSAVVQARTGLAQPRLSVITDGGNGIQNIHRSLSFAVTPILDWFHISMRVRYLEQIVTGLRPQSETERCTKKLVDEYIGKLCWSFWHANREKAEQRMRQILTLCRIVIPETAQFKESLEQLDYRLREFFTYLDNNKGTLIAYGKRHGAGRPISTAMAESAVNQVLNARMCKRQQMRWSPRGAHLLAQVRCAVINGDLGAKLKTFKEKTTEEIPQYVMRFLELLQRAAV